GFATFVKSCPYGLLTPSCAKDGVLQTALTTLDVVVVTPREQRKKLRLSPVLVTPICSFSQTVRTKKVELHAPFSRSIPL
ncbi:MAG: hypothetical protein ACLTC2_13650, partial [Faecalibacillus intestinalis]|uniref:hypothetical protein n=1 Tax=Faecalibacillus intestinalis TaxID=1982626 RepID=UPI003995845C